MRTITKIIRYVIDNAPNIISLIALIVAIISMTNANQQFKENSITSDSLFNVQLENSRKLNDSLIQQIFELQIITSKQLEITDEQLKILTSSLNEEIYAGRPKFQLEGSYIEDTLIINGRFSPTIITPFINIGRRFAYKTRFKAFIVYPDFSGLRCSDFLNYSRTMETNTRVLNTFKPMIPILYRDNYFYCFEIEYYDNVLHQIFKQTEYFHYFLSRGKYSFLTCNEDDKIKVRNIINRKLDELKEAPLE